MKVEAIVEAVIHIALPANLISTSGGTMLRPHVKIQIASFVEDTPFDNYQIYTSSLITQGTASKHTSYCQA